eukprot:2620768-Amphidinium_carterae.1
MTQQQKHVDAASSVPLCDGLHKRVSWKSMGPVGELFEVDGCVQQQNSSQLCSSRTVRSNGPPMQAFHLHLDILNKEEVVANKIDSFI